MKLLIRNLARSTTESEILSLFKTYGKVQSCTLVKDKATGESKGFGFVEMPRPGDAKAARKNLNGTEDAKAARKNLNGTEVAGNKIRVKNAETKQVELKQPKPKEPVPEEPEQKKKPAFNPWTQNR
jgi:RNA recognition motif-containing protein